MDTRFSIGIILTIGAFVLTLYLFGVAIISPADRFEAKNSETIEPVSEGIGPALPISELEHPGEKLFKANCKACHNIHRKVIGPALGGVLERRDSLWVIAMIRNSSKLIASGDPDAVKLFREYNQTQMTAFTTFSDEDLKNLLEYLRLESERSRKPVPMPSGAKV